jgi:hypothetical protein
MLIAARLSAVLLSAILLSFVQPVSNARYTLGNLKGWYLPRNHFDNSIATT